MAKYKVSFVVVMALSALVYMFQYSSRPRIFYAPALKYTPALTYTPNDRPNNLQWSIKDIWNHLHPVYESQQNNVNSTISRSDSATTSAVATATKTGGNAQSKSTDVKSSSTPTPQTNRGNTNKVNPTPTQTKPSSKTSVQSTSNVKPTATQAKPTSTTGVQSSLTATQAKPTSTTGVQSTSNVKLTATQAKPTSTTGVQSTSNVKLTATQAKPTSTTGVQSTSNVKLTATQAKPTAKKNEVKSVTPIIAKVTPTLQTVTPTLPPTTTPKTTKYLCIHFNGRLGNHMYMFASAYGISRRRGMRMVIKPDSTMKAVFNVDGAYETNWGLCSGAKNLGENGCCRVSPHLYNISNDRSYQISGYLQSFKYFDDYKDELRQLLTFREPVLKEAKTKLHNLFEKYYQGKNVTKRTLVGVHVRRGDYLNAGSIKFGYKVATVDFMHRAVKYMKDHFNDVTFIVCSNDVKWTNEALKNETDVILVPMGPAHVDMAVLSLTDHMIMTVGTYGFWASWLVNGTVVYFRNFTDPKTPFGKMFDDGYHDTYPPYWIGL